MKFDMTALPQCGLDDALAQSRSREWALVGVRFWGSLLVHFELRQTLLNRLNLFLFNLN